MVLLDLLSTHLEILLKHTRWFGVWDSTFLQVIGDASTANPRSTVWILRLSSVQRRYIIGRAESHPTSSLTPPTLPNISPYGHLHGTQHFSGVHQMFIKLSVSLGLASVGFEAIRFLLWVFLLNYVPPQWLLHSTQTSFPAFQKVLLSWYHRSGWVPALFLALKIHELRNLEP